MVTGTTTAEPTSPNGRRRGKGASSQNTAPPREDLLAIAAVLMPNSATPHTVGPYGPCA
jgi:hypothetical protein